MKNTSRSRIILSRACEQPLYFNVLSLLKFLLCGRWVLLVIILVYLWFNFGLSPCILCIIDGVCPTV